MPCVPLEMTPCNRLLYGAGAAATAEHRHSSVFVIIVVGVSTSAGDRRLGGRRLTTRPSATVGHEKVPRLRCLRPCCCCWRGEAAGWRSCDGGAGCRQPAASRGRCDRAPCARGGCRAAALVDSCAWSSHRRRRSRVRRSTGDAFPCRRTTADDETCSASTTHTIIIIIITIRFRNDLDCVGWGVKLYSLTHHHHHRHHHTFYYKLSSQLNNMKTKTQLGVTNYEYT